MQLGPGRLSGARGPSPLGWRWPKHWSCVRGICGHGSNPCLITTHRGMGRGNNLGDFSRIRRVSRGPGQGRGGLARCLEDELWPPQVFSIVSAWIDEGSKGGGGGLCIYRV